jgi:hypothetical protein
MRKIIVAFLLLIMPIAPAVYSQFPDSPEKRVSDPVKRFAYITEYNRAIRTLAREKCGDEASVKLLSRLSTGIGFLAVWSDKEVEKRRSTMESLLKEAKTVNQKR